LADAILIPPSVFPVQVAIERRSYRGSFDRLEVLGAYSYQCAYFAVRTALTGVMRTAAISCRLRTKRTPSA